MILIEASRRGRKLHRSEVDWYWQGLNDLSLAQVERGMLEHSKDPQRCGIMPLAGDIRRHLSGRRAAPRPMKPPALDDGERFGVPPHPHLNPALPDSERLAHVDELLAATDPALDALGLKRCGLEFVRGMLTAAGLQDAARPAGNHHMT